MNEQKQPSEGTKPEASASKRPQLKTPAKVANARLPRPVAEIVDDLRERRLLPIAILLIVAIIAVPVLLSKSSPSPKPSLQASPAAASFQAQGQPVVLAAGHGVRDYKKRLDTSAAKDPFVQQYAAPQSGGGSSNSGSNVTATSSGASVAPSTGSKASAGAGAKSTPKYVAFTIDAWVGEAGAMKLRKNIQRLDLLPNFGAPAAVFMGVSRDASKALFMVSSQVSAVSGDGSCLMGPASCNLLFLTPLKTANLLFAPTGKTYAIKPVRINRVVSKQP